MLNGVPGALGAAYDTAIVSLEAPGGSPAVPEHGEVRIRHPRRREFEGCRDMIVGPGSKYTREARKMPSLEFGSNANGNISLLVPKKGES